LVLGVAFKKDIDDARNSSAKKIISKLLEYGAKVHYHDSYIPTFKVGEKILKSVSLSSKEAKNSDVLLIHTAHSNVDLKALLGRFKLIVDTRNATVHFGHRRNIVKI